MEEEESGAAKRKVSFEGFSDQEDESPKRLRQQSYPEPCRSPAQTRRDSGSRISVEEPGRGAQATPTSQEEKNRGKRLFGGLLSTLSQTSTNSHQRRRQDIERRQLERRQRQRDEDSHKQHESSTRLHDIRVREQVVFEDKVMRQKHSKMLWAAQHFETKTEPPIFYSPWKLTKRQESSVEEQTREARARIQNERLEFEKSGRRDSPQHIMPRPSSSPKAGREKSPLISR